MATPKAGHGVVLKRGDGSGSSPVKASRTMGASDAELIVGWDTAGTVGNGKTTEVVENGNSTPLTVVVSTSSVLINVETDGSGNGISTVNDIIAALYADATFEANWFANNGAGDGTGVVDTDYASAALSNGADSTENFTAIGKIVGITPPNRQRQIIEFTTHDNENIQSLVSFLNNGEVGVVIAYDSNDAQHAGLDTDFEDATLRNFQITLPDTGARVIGFSAYVTNHQFMTESTDVLKANATLKIDGAWADV